jgi:F0F1-type ATP synthase assembly protein I
VEESGSNQHLYNGFGSSTARAFELAVTPAIFGFLGHLLDRALGTSPVFLIVFVLFCVAGLGVRMYYGYKHQMDEHEAKGPWSRTVDRRRAEPGGEQ